ncbi:uncharacterized protein CEXT_73101 [Caerostris extrusa]|uniref:C-type lectin domain-containing protein n=1 Tax=Caerostris extrusa TaxID=172846 RepID=A0AAV4Y6I5_CAEEX|nr:uncharacterized protein CEXT_73101 [Caerostris extrusa]
MTLWAIPSSSDTSSWIRAHSEKFTERIYLFIVIFCAGSLTDCAEKKACDKPWRTFRNVCFMFSDTNRQKYDEAQSVCYRLGGFLASIRSSAEHGFIIKTIQGMGSSYQRVRWYIGLYQYDPADNKGYRWLDGSVSTFRNWMTSQPNSYTNDARCWTEAMASSGEMMSAATGRSSFAEKIWMNGNVFSDFFNNQNDNQYKRISAKKGVIACIVFYQTFGIHELFQGQTTPSKRLEQEGHQRHRMSGALQGTWVSSLAGLIPNICFCLNKDSVGNMKAASRLQCDGNCGNQHCGNKDFITIYNLTYYKDTAESCEDLSLLGFSSPTYVTKVGDEEKLMNCFSGDGDYRFFNFDHASNEFVKNSNNNL